MIKRTSIIWKISTEEFKQVVLKNDTFSSILKHFGLVLSSGNYKTLKRRLKFEDIDYSHIPQGIDSNKGRKFNKRAIPLKEVMIENSTYDRGSLKKRLLRDGILENKCNICGQGDIWNNKNIVMVLDHINGINNDHRIENLRMLCPNCNSQQETFSGRHLRKKYNCNKCGKEITKNSKLCKSCVSKQQPRKVKNRPSKKQLLKEIEEGNYCAVGRTYGVSDTCIRKWLK